MMCCLQVLQRRLAQQAVAAEGAAGRARERAEAAQLEAEGAEVDEVGAC